MPLLLKRLVLGLALGVLARVWMRLISDDPEFSWGGTVGVVGVFVLFALGTGISLMLSTGSRTKDRIGRGVGLLFLLPLFGAAGAQMMPTVILGSLSLHRTTWKSWIRVLFGLLALVLPVRIVLDQLINKANPWSLLGMLMFMATYAAVVIMTAPIFCRRRASSSLEPTSTSL